MENKTIRILLAEDNPGDVRLIGEYLKSSPDVAFDLTSATTLKEALEIVESGTIDVLVSDLGLPDSQGIDTLLALVRKDPMLPIMVITGLNDHALGVEAVKRGAQDFLVKGEFEAHLLVRSIVYTIERKMAVNQKLLTNNILSTLNRHNEWQEILKDILRELQAFTGIQAAAIRLRMEQEYPYFEYNGFPERFIRDETFLCARDDAGQILLNSQGMPVLECLCGNVIMGRTDSALPVYTEGGSFWTNSTTRYLAETPGSEMPSLPRNRCNREGYESVALIPIRAGDQVLGLIQLNDKRTGRFSLMKIRFFEEIGSILGIAFRRIDAEQQVKERVKELNVLHNISIFSEICASVEEYANGIVDLIQMGFQDEKRTVCRIEIEGREYENFNFAESKVRYASDILFNDRTIGKLELGILPRENLTDIDTFLQEEKELIITIAKQIGDYVGRKRADAVQKVIHDIAGFTNTNSSLEELVSYIREKISTLIDTTNFYIAMYSEESDSLSIPYFADEKDSFTEFPAGNTLTGYVIKTQQSLLATRAELDQMAAEGKIESIGAKARVWLGIPLKIKGKVIGVFAVQSYSDELAYDVNDLVMMEMISQQISISIERKKSEMDLMQALERAKESDRLKSAFLATMSHELRTPLNAVIGFSQLIDEETPRGEVLEFVSHILQGGRHLLSIIEDILNISVIESGLIEIVRSDYPLSTVLHEVREWMTLEHAKSQKHDIQVIHPTSDTFSEISIHTDAEKLKQILKNLLKNALKFTDRGSIIYGVEPVTQNGISFLQFFVQDTGIGMSGKVQTIIFDLFRQADESHTRTHGGTGLGLSVSKKLVELLGGSIAVESEPDVGSRFTFTIPFDEKFIVTEPVGPTAEQDKKPAATGKNILIAEDEDSNYELLEILLTTKGFHVLRAENGKEAVRHCNEHTEIDLVLMDLKMPVMNGYEATTAIRSMFPDLPVIAQTAYAMPEDRANATKAGCNGLITKPIKKEELFSTMEKWLNKQSNPV